MRPVAMVLVALLATPCAAAAQDVATSQAASAPSDTAADAGLIRRLFTTLGRDIKQLPSRDNLPTLLNGSVLTLAVLPFDRIGTERASSSRALKAGFAGVGKEMGREWVQGGGALAAYATGRLWGKPRLVQVSGDLIEAQITSATITQGLKFLVNRTRPDGEARSFPSGHASAAFATASTLHRHFGGKAAIPAYAAAIYTSLSRLQANSHYASDVFAGATLGLAVGRTATIELGRQRLEVAPAAAPGAVGIVFTSARR